MLNNNLNNKLLQIKSRAKQQLKVEQISEAEMQQQIDDRARAEIQKIMLNTLLNNKAVAENNKNEEVVGNADLYNLLHNNKQEE